MKEIKEQIIELFNQYLIMLQLIQSANAKVEVVVESDNFFMIALKANYRYCLSIRCLDSLEPTLKIHGLPREDTFPCDDLSECKELIDMYFDHIKTYYNRCQYKTT